MRIDVLDKGFVELEDCLGNDLSVVNAARISYGRHSAELNEADKKLIHFLIKEHHTKPFCHPQVVLFLKMPIFVARQLRTHQVGMVWSEKSLRYTEAAPECYIPESMCDLMTVNLVNQLLQHYKDLVKIHVPKEEARTILPLGIYSEFRLTASLQGLLHLLEQRDTPHAQFETRQYARAIKQILRPLFPVTMQARFPSTEQVDIGSL